MDVTLKGQWNQIQGKVKETWGKLTDDELTKIDGDFEQLVGVVQERYGYAKDKASAEVSEFVNRIKHVGS